MERLNSDATEFIKSKFDPQVYPENTLEAFLEYVNEFQYSYEAIAKEPASTLTAEAKAAWIQTNKRKVFLGKFASRNLQKELEEVTTEAERSALTFADLVTRLTERFQLSSNTTLSNYKFRKLTQTKSETFDMFVIRVKKHSQQCNFSCNATCTVRDTMVRDQLILGTKDDEIRRQALHEQWDLATLIQKGRSLEAATHGASEIKTEGSTRIKTEEGEYSGIRRTKPKKYSRKYEARNRMPKNKNNEQTNKSCDTCSSQYCKGKKCPGKEVTCFACNKRGHYKGAKVCKNSRNARRLEDSEDEATETDYEESSPEGSTAPESSSSEDERERRKPASRRVRVQGKRRPITVARISANDKKCSENGSPFPKEILSIKTRAQEGGKGRYTVQVTVRGKRINAFADTGADICIMSYANAKKLKLPLQKTRMKIKPYGSKSKACKGCYTGSIMCGEAVTNATIYVIKKDVETLLSGRVCEQLDIIKFQERNVSSVSVEDPEKQKLLDNFPQLFKGVGKLEDYQVNFHIDSAVRPVCQPARPIPFHLRKKFVTEIEEMERQGIIEEHTGPSPWVSNVVLAPKDDGSVRVTVDLREPNKAIKPTHTPIMNPEEIKAQLAPYKVFSKLDFKSAFHQLELDEESRRMTVFRAGDRLMKFKRLTMGSTPASGELTRALRPLFSNSKDTFVIHDDVIVAGRDKKEHDENLMKACSTIHTSGMTLNIDKCLIAKTSIPWWGLIISDKGITPDPSKVTALQQATPPTDKSEVLSFLCMIQSNKDFIPNLASKTVNLRQLTKKHQRFRWTKECPRELEVLR